MYPERVLTSQNSAVTLRCQVSGAPPHYYYWSREDGRLISGSAERRRQGNAPPPRAVTAHLTTRFCRWSERVPTSVQERSWSSPASSRVMPACTCARAGISAAPTGVERKSLSQVCTATAEPVGGGEVIAELSLFCRRPIKGHRGDGGGAQSSDRPGGIDGQLHLYGQEQGSVVTWSHANGPTGPSHSSLLSLFHSHQLTLWFGPGWGTGSCPTGPWTLTAS